MHPFDFSLKHFGIWQGRTAMKVGTDAIALGAWTASLALPATHILDIGAGTGILSLMLAQTNEQAYIDAVELEDGAYRDMCANFEASPWSKRLHPIHADALAYSAGDNYDLIISNPPFFLSTAPRAEGYSRQLARGEQLEGLGIASLVLRARQLLSPQGALCMICPSEREEDLRLSACEAGMYIEALCIVYSKASTPVRLMALLRPLSGLMHYTPSRKDHLTLRDFSGKYSSEYKSLTSEFLLQTE
ncbi:MAG: methyltransferase [Porphyromonas sp.]|nr:methyltransferase [Porphyromonas sp.]